MNNMFSVGSNVLPKNEGSTATLITAKMFFGKDGGTAYETPPNFLAFGESLRPKEATDWKKLLECMAKNMRMDGNPATGVDAGNRSYTFHRLYKSKAVLGFKMVNGGGMPKLIEDYQEGLITIGFTLEDLIAEAQKS
jgi:hypothetical protein